MDEKKEGFNYMIGLFVRPGCMGEQFAVGNPHGFGRQTTSPGDHTQGYQVVQVPKQHWAIFRSDEVADNSKGSEIPKLLQRAYTEWLPSSGYERTPGGPDFEIYAYTDAGKYYEEVWIPVKKV